MIRFLGLEYPAVFIREGVRYTLYSERRWSRFYRNREGDRWTEISRLMDGSAAITFPEFAQEWPTWNREERQDFCGGCSWLHDQADFPDILRFIMSHGGTDDWSAVAGNIAEILPQDEAFGLLTAALPSYSLDEAANVIQGIAITQHPEAANVLRDHLAVLWAHPTLWEDDEFTNGTAYGAVCCIGHLIELGMPPQEFTEQVRQLAAHPCGGNRDSCRQFLTAHFPWLDDGQSDEFTYKA